MFQMIVLLTVLSIDRHHFYNMKCSIGTCIVLITLSLIMMFMYMYYTCTLLCN